nr:unnamed protein product [Spirometra erinaceieuropaei]
MSRSDDSFRHLRKMAAKSARDDWKEYWDEVATCMEQASNVRDTRNLNHLIDQVSGRPSTWSDPLRDVNGGFIDGDSAKVEHWLYPFERHHNFDTQPITSLISNAAEFLPSPNYAVSCDIPSKGEAADVILKLRKNKTPGADDIPSEI